jgi:transcriptional regulator with XRE-family HTH domain
MAPEGDSGQRNRVNFEHFGWLIRYVRCENARVPADMTVVARRFLRAVRGRRSQTALSRRLGFKGNPIADWEAGRRMPTAEQTFRVCQAVGLDVTQAFAHFHPAPPPKGCEFNLTSWLNAVRGAVSLVDLATRTNYSRYQVARWLQGNAKPRLPQFLRVVDILTGRLSDLLAGLVPIDAIPEIVADHLQRDAARRLAYEEPWTEAILRVVETEGYQSLPMHVTGHIARQLGISESTEMRCLQKLEVSGILERHHERYVCVGSLNVDTHAAPTLKVHWSDVARNRILSPSPDDLFAYNVFSVSASDLHRIRELLRAAFRQARAIAAATPTTERVALINVQLACWNDPDFDQT